MMMTMMMMVMMMTMMMMMMMMMIKWIRPTNQVAMKDGDIYRTLQMNKRTLEKLLVKE